ncbi:MAG: peptidoglycan DD-metalloendopeptidase family protein [Candidatus Paceibacterota bacterium]|jgi:murein DD-endopeptidase MepM/ murein hydrolase activator NlpD
MIKTRKPILLLSVAVILISNTVFAQTKDDLQAKIDQKNKDIQALHVEIESLGKQIDELGSQATSLSNTIKSLGLTRKKLEANISVTQDKISAKNYEIQKLGKQISGKESDIEDDKRIIIKTFSSIQEIDNRSLLEMMLSSDSFSKAWDFIEQLNVLQTNLYDRIDSLNKDKTNLETNKKATEKAKAELVALNKELSDQRAIVLSTTAEQNALLKQTNQSEASYKRVLADKKAQEAAFQAEINEYESQLNLLINPALIPHTGSGVLLWPLTKIFITQYFGNTSFSTANPQIYNGKGHTGIDFRASIGTPVKAAGSGIVIGTGNTDLYRGCYSYGQWIMIKHPNGLSTLYAHLSLRTVSLDQEVTVGEMIGYSGNSGYSTGPHLHFGVYATQGIQIKKFTNSTSCRGATIPIADYKAYLNPLSYL